MLKYPGLVFLGVLSLVSACGDDGAAPADAGVDTAGPIDAAVDAAIAPICGNGQMEQGEECDDGLAGLSHDGCSSTCKVEALTWRNLTPNLMVPRWNHAMAFDTSRSTAVMFGGVNTQLGVNAETFEWDGQHWIAQTPTVSPPAREKLAMTFDGERDRVVVFGGADATGAALGDTWTWDGAAWLEAMPATSPPPRYEAFIAYDPVREVVVLWGGRDETTAFHDTWEWDGTTWTQKFPANVPPYGAAAMSWTGSTVRLVYSNANWEFDGTNWTRVPFDYIGPWGDTDQAWAVYDSVANQQLLVTARGNDEHGQHIFFWNGTDWRPVVQPATGGIGRRGYMAIAFDPTTDTILTYGGIWSSSLDSLPFTFQWSSTSGWVEVSDSIPPSRNWTSLVYDAYRSRLVMFGGDTWGKRLNDTWEWDGTGWTGPTLTTLPPKRQTAELAYDSLRGEVVMFGGRSETYDGVGNLQFDMLDDTWVYDGSTWAERTPAHSPPACVPGMTFDAARGYAILFTAGQTWTWDGIDWTERHPVHAPTGDAFSMAYDARRQRTVMVSLGGTWEWDGTDWANATPPTTTPQYVTNLFYDPIRGRVLSQGAGPTASMVVQEWDGTTWTVLSSTDALRASKRLQADPTTRSWFLFGAGGWNTWQGRYESTETDEQCDGTDADADGLVSCADPDCWARCTPLCPPRTTCPANAPRCGDGTCSSIEDHALCPADCP